MRLTDVLAELEGRNQFEMLGEKLPAGPDTPNRDRAAGLAFIETRRREGVAPAKLFDDRGEAWAYAAVAIPELDMAVFARRFPELRSKDRETRRRAWHKFFREFGGMYGCDASIGKRKRNTGVIVR